MGRRRALSAVSVAGLAVVLTGCMKLDMDLTVNENDTVDGEMVVGIDRGLAEMSGESDAMIDEMLAQEDIPEGVSGERYEDDDYLGTRYIFDGQSIDEFQGDDTNQEALSIVRDGEEFVVTGTLDLSQASPENMGDMGGMGEGILDSFDIRIALTFPGDIVETNGEVDGSTVVWEPAAGEALDISARAEASPGGVGGLPIWAWILIGVVVVAALVGLFFVVRRSNKAGDEPSAPVEAYAVASQATYQPGQEQQAGFSQQEESQAGGVAPPPAPPAPSSETTTPETASAETASAETASAEPSAPAAPTPEPPAPEAPTTPASTTPEPTTPETTSADPAADPDAGEQVEPPESPRGN